MSVHSTTRLLIHIIWGTHKREKVLRRSIRVNLHNCILKYCGEHAITLLVGFINAEHVHILVDLQPNQNVSEVVKLIKGSSSHWLNQNEAMKRKFSWGRGFGAFSVSESNAPAVMKYISEQEDHHSRKAFTDEFEEFISKYKAK